MSSYPEASYDFWLDPLIKKAKKRKRIRLAVVGATNSLVVESAFSGYQQGLIDPILIGERTLILKETQKIGWVPDHIVDIAGEEHMAQAMLDLVSSKRANGVMKGQIHTDILMSALISKRKEIFINKRLVHIFVIWMPGKPEPFLVSDAALNVAPNMETRKTALQMMLRLASLLDMEKPRIAILSATESVINSVPSSLEARTLEEWAKENLPKADIRGPLSLDLAYSPQSAVIKKMTHDPVAGRANGFLVPDLVSGNILYKSMVYFGNGCAAGLITGANIPILLTSRADPAEARMASIALASLYNDPTATPNP